MSDEIDWRGDGCQPLFRSTVAGHVIHVHGTGEVKIGIRVEAPDQRFAVIVQVAFDIVGGAEGWIHGWAGGNVAAKPAAKAFARVIGGHRRHPGDGESLVREGSPCQVLATMPFGIGHDGAATDFAMGGDAERAE